jgi:hypothetical protein
MRASAANHLRLFRLSSVIQMVRLASQQQHQRVERFARHVVQPIRNPIQEGGKLGGRSSSRMRGLLVESDGASSAATRVRRSARIAL